MKSYLSDTSAHLTCSAGVPQGSVLDPVSFSFCVNQTYVDMQKYADDAVLYCHDSSQQEAAAVLSGATVPVSHGPKPALTIG